ncbi:DUF4349 domain-containing protein [Mesonia maritima]|uniref:DUF4349 domain-containing protein n=1 Tax=Mesonia maritima TaxID=1793873 RepID=A0ABU1K336_9FLAO|nr:DUF4349 domain-containing protein [Mesonia maritima]MDR6300018.1 hypothetical protein [Mesonia maritima]
MKKILATLSLLAVLSCNSSSENDTNFETSSLKETSAVSNSIIEKPQIPSNRKIIWNADLEFQVENVDRSTQKISSLCKKYNGFISNMKLNNTNYEVSNEITIRIDNKDFENLINELKGISVFNRKVEINSNDVTEEFIDIQSRLETKKQVRERYIDILKNRTGEIKDVLAAEDAIRKITEEIEAKEGKLRYLNDKVNYSTINLEIFQKVDFKSAPETFEKSFLTEVKESLSNGWEIVIGFILLLLNIWPLLLILVIWLVWKRKWLKRKLKK